MSAEAWDPSRLRGWIRERYEAGAPGAIRWALRMQDAGMTVAAYECPVTADSDVVPALMLPADHSAPEPELPYACGPVSWPFQLVAVARPAEGNVVPLRRAAGEG